MTTPDRDLAYGQLSLMVEGTERYRRHTALVRSEADFMTDALRQQLGDDTFSQLQDLIDRYARAAIADFVDEMRETLG